MKITLTVFQGLLLIGLTCSSKNCRREKQETYSIYNSTMDLKAYYCSDNSDCHTNNTKFPPFLYKNSNFCEFGQSLCELPVTLNLLDDIVKVSNNLSCSYIEWGGCYNYTPFKSFFRRTRNYKNMSLIYTGPFNVWRSESSPEKFIEGRKISLILTESVINIKYGMKLWKTNHDGIVVVKNNTNVVEGFARIQSDLRKFCDNVKENKTNLSKSMIEASKTWHVYKYPAQVTVHQYLENAEFCEKVFRGQVEEKNNKVNFQHWKNYFCEPSSCNYDIVTLCRYSSPIDVEEDKVISLSPECKYSDGVCISDKTFWQYSDRCETIKKVGEGEVKQISETKHVLKRVNSEDLTILQKGNLCGEDVWYTDQEGVVVSDRNLKFHVSSRQAKYNPVFSHGSLGTVESWRYREYFLTASFAPCFVWILLKMVGCLVYCLWRKRGGVGIALECFELQNLESDERSHYEEIPHASSLHI